MSAPRHPDNTVKECRYPGLPCDRVCLECSGSPPFGEGYPIIVAHGAPRNVPEGSYLDTLGYGGERRRDKPRVRLS